MKKQLLEDFGDSASQPAPARRPDPAPAPAHVPPRVWRARAAPPRPVWRARDGAVAQESAAPEPSPLPPPAPPAPEPASFASQQPDLRIALPAVQATWGERWGRRLFGWGLAIVVAGAALGGGAWVYRDTQVVSTLALVADQSPAPVAEPWVEPRRDSAPPPALVLVPKPPEPEPAPVPAPVPAPPVVDNGEEAARAAAEAVKRAEMRRAEARKEAQRKEANRKEANRKEAQRKEANRKEASRKEAQKAAAARAARTGDTAQPDPAAQQAAQQAETLRQCRAAGYHASQCRQRGCVATRYGLACRG